MKSHLKRNKQIDILKNLFSGEDGGIRTLDTPVKSRMLYR